MSIENTERPWKLGDVVVLACILGILICIVPAVRDSISEAKIEDAKLKASLQQDQADFEKSYNTPARIPHHSSVYEDMKDDARKIALKSKGAKVREALLIQAQIIVNKQKQLENLQNDVDAHTDLDSRLTNIAELKNEIVTEKKNFERLVFLAYRFCWTFHYMSIHSTLQRSTEPYWSSIIDDIRRAENPSQ